MNELESIRELQRDKKAIKLEAEAKDQRIRDLEVDLQRSLATEGDFKKRNAAAKIAVEKAQADSKLKAKQIRDQKRAKEAALQNAAVQITDLQAENAVLKEQIDDAKVDLKTSTDKIEDLETLIAKQPSPTEANGQANSIWNLTSSVDQLTSIVAEQAKSLADINTTMVDFKNVNKKLVKELASQKGKRAVAEEKAAGLLEKFHAERQKREELEKQIDSQAADDQKLTAMAAAAAAAPVEAVSTTEPSRVAIVQDDAPLSESSSLVIPTVASAPTSPSLRHIFDNLILMAYYFLFGNLFLTFNLLSLVILPGTQLFQSTFFQIFCKDHATEWKTAADTDTGEKIARMPGGWRWWEEH